MRAFKIKSIFNIVKRSFAIESKDAFKAANNKASDFAKDQKSDLKQDKNLNEDSNSDSKIDNSASKKAATAESIGFDKQKSRGEGRNLKGDVGSGSSNEKNMERNAIHETINDKQDNTFGEKHEFGDKSGNKKL